MTQEHSPLGGSGAYRWMPCPGSAYESQGIEDPESEYAAEGTAAHALAAYHLIHGGDAWEAVGRSFIDGSFKVLADVVKETIILPFVDVDKDMADAVQEYLDAVRVDYPDRNQGNTWVERSFHCPSIHELMWGKADLAHLEPVTHGDVIRLHVRDYKHGVGIVVLVEHNLQLMYYGVGMLEDLGLWDVVDEVVLWVDQPRAWMDSPRSWTVSVADLATWRDEVLVPAMELAAWVLRNDQHLTHDELIRLNLLNSGEHCRFCAARYHNCPRHVLDMEKMEGLMNKIEAAGGAPKATNAEVGEFLTLFEVAKIRGKALRETAFARAQAGHDIPGHKLVLGKSNREWKDGVEAKAKKLFKKDAMVPPKLRSPAQVDKLPGGKAFSAEYAFKPDKGLQLVLADDIRSEAGPKGRAMFTPLSGKGGKK